MVLDDEAIAAFARDGVACLRSVLDPGDPGAFTEDFCRWPQIPQIERLARHGLHAELPAGAELDHALFPVVWPA